MKGKPTSFVVGSRFRWIKKDLKSLIIKKEKNLMIKHFKDFVKASRDGIIVVSHFLTPAWFWEATRYSFRKTFTKGKQETESKPSASGCSISKRL